MHTQKLTTSPFGFKAGFSSGSAGRRKKPSAAATPLTGNALAAPPCPALPPAKRAKALTGAKPPAVSHAHQSCSQTLLVIAADSHEDAKRPRAGVPEWYPGTQGTTGPQRGQEPPRDIPRCLPMLSWQPCPGTSRASSRAQPPPEPKSFSRVISDFFCILRAGVQPSQMSLSNPLWISGEGGEHRRTQPRPARRGPPARDPPPQRGRKHFLKFHKQRILGDFDVNVRDF